MAAHARAPLVIGQVTGQPAKAAKEAGRVRHPRRHSALVLTKSQAGITFRGACTRAGASGRGASHEQQGDVHNPLPAAPGEASADRGMEPRTGAENPEGAPCSLESAATAKGEGGGGGDELLMRSDTVDGSAAATALELPGPASAATASDRTEASEGAAQSHNQVTRAEPAAVSSTAEAPNAPSAYPMPVAAAATTGTQSSLSAPSPSPPSPAASGGVYGHNHNAGDPGAFTALPHPNHHYQNPIAAQTPPSLAINATTILLTLVLSTFTALGASMFAVIKIMQPALQNTEKAAKEMQQASLELKKAAIDMQKTADMFQKEVPEMTSSIQQTSVEFEELGRTLNAVSGGWRGTPKRSKGRKGGEQGDPAEEGGRQQRMGEPAGSAAEGSSAAKGASRVRPAGGWTSRTTAGVSIRNSRVRRVPLQAPGYTRLPPGAIGADEALLMEEQAALALFEDRVPPESGWYSEAVSGLWQFTKGIQSAISPRAKQVQTAVGGITDLFDNAKRAEAARLRRKEAARAWITDWRSRTGVEVKTELAPAAAEGSEGPEGSASAAAAATATAAQPTLAESAAVVRPDAGPGPGSHPLLADQAEQEAAMDKQLEQRQQQLDKLKQASASAVLDYSIDIHDSSDWLDWDEAAAKDDEDADESWQRAWPRSGIPAIPDFESKGPGNVLNTMAMMREIHEAVTEISDRVIIAQQEESKELHRDDGASPPRSPTEQRQQQTKEPPGQLLKSDGAARGSFRGPWSSSSYDSDDYDEFLRDEDIKERSFYSNPYKKSGGSNMKKRIEGRSAAEEEQGGNAKGSSVARSSPRSPDDASADERKPVKGGDKEKAGTEDGESAKGVNGKDDGGQWGPRNNAARAALRTSSQPAAQPPPSL